MTEDRFNEQHWTVPVLTFRLGDHHYALFVEEVVEVAAMVELVPVTGSPPYILGMANRHGDALPMLDLRVLMGVEASPVDISTLFIVVSAGRDKVGIVVDEIQQVEYVPTELISNSPTSSKHIRGIIGLKQRLIQIVDLASIMAAYMSGAVSDDWLKVDS